MIEHHRYEGHDIEIELRQVAPRQVAWAARIDGRHKLKGGVASTRVDVARSEALMYAQLMLRRLDRASAEPA